MLILTNKVRQFREASNLTLKELSDISHIGLSTISNIETGLHIPRIDTAILVARALGQPVETIFSIEDI